MVGIIRATGSQMGRLGRAVEASGDVGRDVLSVLWSPYGDQGGKGLEVWATGTLREFEGL